MDWSCNFSVSQIDPWQQVALQQGGVMRSENNLRAALIELGVLEGFHDLTNKEGMQAAIELINGQDAALIDDIEKRSGQ